MDKKENLAGFLKLVSEMRAEYIEKKGAVTIEFSTSPEHLVEKLEILSNNNINNDDCGGYWFVFPCDTCKGHDASTPLHVMIIDTKSSKDYMVAGDLYRQEEVNASLTKELKLKTELLESGIIVDPKDLLHVVSIALEHQQDLPARDKDSTLLFMSNCIDNYFEQQDESNPLVSDPEVQAKAKELERLDNLICQRKRELELIEGAFSTMIPVAPATLKKIADNASCNAHSLIPEHIRAINYIQKLTM